MGQPPSGKLRGTNSEKKASQLQIFSASKIFLQLMTKRPINAAVSMGRRNTRRKSQVQEFQGLRIIREHKSKEKASCLGKSELQPQSIGPLETYCQIE